MPDDARCSPSLLATALLVPALIGACTTGATIGGTSQYAVNTADYYSENRVCFLDAASAEAPAHQRRLLYSYELGHDKDLDIQRLHPLGVVVRGVRLPSDLKGRRDLAVVLDVVTSGSEGATSMVVYYQRDVPGGQMLNFQDLLVYYDPEWDGLTPPYFRVRVLEVNSERNARTNDFLEQAGKLPGALGGIAPHPLLPIVQTAIEAAKLTLGNRRNRVIIDYQVQFYSRAQIEGAGASVLSPLRMGEWLVVGRERGAASEFWNDSFQLDLRSGLLQRPVPATTEKPDPGLEAVEVPYVAVVVLSADAVVPKHIMDRSQALIDLLSSPIERTDFDGIVSAIDSLQSAGNAFRAERRLKQYMTTADFNEVIELLKTQASVPELRIPQERSLVRLVDDLVVGRSFGTVKEVLAWWGEQGVAAGAMIEDAKAPLGFRWHVETPAADGGP